MGEGLADLTRRDIRLSPMGRTHKTSALILPNIDYFQVVFTHPDKPSGLTSGNRKPLARLNATRRIFAEQTQSSSFRGINPIDEASTVIVFAGSPQERDAAVKLLKQSSNGLVGKPFDHGDDTYELHVKAPIGSSQLLIVSARCGIRIHSIDHVPEPLGSEFAADLRRYLRSDRALRRIVEESSELTARDGDSAK